MTDGTRAAAEERYTVFHTEWGWMAVVIGARGIKRIFLPLARREVVREQVVREFPDALQERSPQEDWQGAFQSYFRGKNAPSFPAVDWEGYSPFTVQVWKAAQAIARGEVRTYRWLSRRIHRPTAQRAVGNALGRNPFPLVVPCHRVVRSDGRLGGYSAAGGLGLKRRLLEMEGLLFDDEARVVFTAERRSAGGCVTGVEIRRNS